MSVNGQHIMKRRPRHRHLNRHEAFLVVIMKLDQVTNEANQKALRLAETGLYSDLTIKCGEKEYPVHKVLICTRSQFFAKACNGHFQEGQTGIIDLSHDDPEAVDSLICYIYKGYYPRTSPSVTGKTDTFEGVKDVWNVSEHGDPTEGIKPKFLVLNAKVYALAEKYAVTGLKEMAIRYFTAGIAGRAAEDEGIFAKAAEAAYTGTIDSDRGLRDVIVSYLYCYSDYLQNDDIQELLKTCPSLSFDIIMHHSKAEHGKMKKRKFNPRNPRKWLDARPDRVYNFP